MINMGENLGIWWDKRKIVWEDKMGELWDIE